MPEVLLTDAIRQLRSQLTESMEHGEDEKLRFVLGDIDLELQVIVSKEGKGEAGIKFWLVSVGGTATASTGTTHTVRLRLTPEMKDGAKARVGRSGRG
ncbi:MAG: trypco2 family protein [Gaiellaceae bacterium]